jgi:glycosyltransferase involved in cell wall biosynthesis
MTAALIGLSLCRITGLPWVLDLRDPMSQDNYPHDPIVRRVWTIIERACMRRVSRVIFTAESTRQLYLNRYPQYLTPEQCILIPNGFDEDDFTHLSIAQPAPIPESRPVRLVHSGLIYPVERDPRPMFSAVSRLKKMGRINADKVQIIFRASGSEGFYRKLLAERNIADIIRLEPHMTYRLALQECAEADGLLLFQAADCDMQIPAKAYEYLRIGKPILALTTHTGDTAALLKEVGGGTIVNIASEDEIYEGLSAFAESLRKATQTLPDKARIARYTRQAQASQLAKVLNGVIATPVSETIPGARSAAI